MGEIHSETAIGKRNEILHAMGSNPNDCEVTVWDLDEERKKRGLW